MVPHMGSALAMRIDIFTVDRDVRIYKSLAAALLLSLVLGIYLMTTERIFLVVPSSPTVLTLEHDYIQLLPLPQAEKSPPPPKIRKHSKTIRLPHGQATSHTSTTGPSTGSSHGNGSFSETINGAGILQYLHGKTTIHLPGSTSAVTSTLKSLSGDLDAIIATIANVQNTGRPSVGRKGIPSHDFNQGFTGEGGDGIAKDILTEGALGDESSIAAHLPTLTKTKAAIQVLTSPHLLKDIQSMQTGGRSSSAIHQVVSAHLPGLRYEYNKRLAQLPKLQGKITVRFVIEPSGKVSECQLLSSTINDTVLEEKVLMRIKGWTFESCLECSAARITFPFAFSQ